jgi:CRISPR-associated protein Csy1
MNEYSVLIEAFIRKKQEDKVQDFCPKSWLDSASKRASQIAIATHVLKFTNSDAKGTNIYLKTDSDQNSSSLRYVSTESLKIKHKDIVGNAAAMDVAGLLQIEVNGITLLDLIEKNDSTPLAPFAETEEQLSGWMQGFKSVLIDTKLTLHTLAKQIYFPLENENYHLLAPLYSSSLSQALYDQIQENRFGEKAKEARECKRKEQFSDLEVINYPNLAVQKFGGTKPQNISRLNSLRGGKSYLLRSVPPVWKSIDKLPMKKNEFWRRFERRAVNELNEFVCFLKTVQRDRNKDIKDKGHSYVQRLVDILIQLSAEIQKGKPGWSVDSEIPLHEKIWLDPFYEELKEKRETEFWRESISTHFARWVMGKLKKNYDDLSDSDHEYFKSECLTELRELES